MKDDTLAEKINVLYSYIDTIYTQVINSPESGWLVKGLIVAFLFWFFWIRPRQNKRDKKQDETLKNTQETVQQILQQQNQNAQLSPQEQQANEKSIETLLTSQIKQAKVAVSQLLEDKNIDGAIDTLISLEQEQSQDLSQQKQHLVKTKLWLATILDYTNPEEAENYLKEAVELEPKNLKAINQYGLLLMRLGNRVCRPTI